MNIDRLIVFAANAASQFSNAAGNIYNASLPQPSALSQQIAEAVKDIVDVVTEKTDMNGPATSGNTPTDIDRGIV